MHSLSILGLVALSAPLASAAFDGNLNYHSPSRRHVNLGINVPAVSRRSLKRGAVPYQPSDLNFTHGIASGDPYPDSVILWTRVAPSQASDSSNVTVEGTVALYNHETDEYIKADPYPICVEWKVWEAKSVGRHGGHSGDNVVSKGTAYTTSDIDYTVKVCKRHPLVAQKAEADMRAGRGQTSQTVYHLQLPVHRLQVQQHQPCWQNKDGTLGRCQAR